jgi:hypothetical protein
MKNKKIPLCKTLLLILLTINTTVQIAADTKFKIVDGMSNPLLRAKMEENVNTMIEDFNSAAEEQEKTVKLSKDNFTSEAINGIKRIWKTSAMSCPPVNIHGVCLKTSSGYQVRGIPVDMIEAEDKEARQELTIDFLPTGKICNVSIAIDMHRYDQIMAQKSSDLDYNRRQIIVNFIEDFRTAYNRRDLKLLHSVYSDKALIITGRVVREKPNSDLTRMTLSNNKVVYIKQTKREYLEKLAKVFKHCKYLNVKFEDIEVVQHPKYDDIYGVTLKQYWKTSTYSDEGYLFLMIDFKDKDNPLIQVRTWQPYKDNKGNVIIAKKDVFHLGSFRIVR